MKSIQRVIGGLVAAVALVVVAIVYSTHAVRSSDHQDTYNLANRSNTSADITDVYVFPSSANSANVVLAMDVSPLIPAGMGTAKFFDPTLMWQFEDLAFGRAASKIKSSSSASAAPTRAQVDQRLRSGEAQRSRNDATRSCRRAGTVAYNASATLSNGVQVFAGPRADPFFFDLFAFFSFLGDRNAAAHTSQSRSGHGQHADQQQQRRRRSVVRNRRQQECQSRPAVVRRLHGRNVSRYRRLRVPHGPARAERARRSRRRLQRPFAGRRSSAFVAHDRFLELGHSRLGDGQLVDRFIGAPR